MKTAGEEDLPGVNGTVDHMWFDENIMIIAREWTKTIEIKNTLDWSIEQVHGIVRTQEALIKWDEKYARA